MTFSFSCSHISYNCVPESHTTIGVGLGFFASHTSSGVGLGFFASSPDMAMTQPGVQYPHWLPLFSAICSVKAVIYLRRAGATTRCQKKSVGEVNTYSCICKDVNIMVVVYT